MINFFKKHWEVLSYLVFGVLCTLLNIVPVSYTHLCWHCRTTPKPSLTKRWN